MANSSIIIRDIFRGFSQGIYKNAPVYFRHQNFFDQAFYEELYDEKMANMAAPTEADLIESCIKGGSWSEKQESEYKIAKMTLDKAINSLDATAVSARAFINKQIEGLEVKFKKINDEREKNVPITREKIAARSANDELVLQLCYVDKNLTVLVDAPDDDELSELYNIYLSRISLFTNENIRDAAFNQTIQNTMMFCRSPFETFGIVGSQITFFQSRFLVYSQILKNIHKSGENVPLHVRDDAGKLIDWWNLLIKEREQENSKVNEKTGDKAGTIKSGMSGDKQGFDLHDAIRNNKFNSSSKLMKN